MSAYMYIRKLFHAAGTSLNSIEARQAISDIVNADGLREAVTDNDGFMDDMYMDESDEVLRQVVHQKLVHMLDEFMDSLSDAEVSVHRMGGIEVYMTGGMSYGDAPTEAYRAWDFLVGNDVPEGWQDQIGRALGLMTVTGGTEYRDGTVAVNFRPW